MTYEEWLAEGADATHVDFSIQWCEENGDYETADKMRVAFNVE